jgi:nitrite reductase (NADH) small subunit
VAVGAHANFAPGSLRAVLKRGVRLVVGRGDAGFFALDGICPHAGAVLAEGMLDGGLLICPLHAFAFDTVSGRCVDDEGCSVRRYEVRQSDAALEVKLGPGNAS